MLDDARHDILEQTCGDEVLDAIEEALVASDMGVDTTLKVVDALEERVGKDKISGDDEISLQEAVKNIEDAYKILAAEISVAIPDVGDHVDMS